MFIEMSTANPIQNDFNQFHKIPTRSRRMTPEIVGAIRSFNGIYSAVVRRIGVTFNCDFRGCGLRWGFNWFG